MNARETEGLRWFRQAQADMEVVRTLHLHTLRPRRRLLNRRLRIYCKRLIRSCGYMDNRKILPIALSTNTQIM